MKTKQASVESREEQSSRKNRKEPVLLQITEKSSIRRSECNRHTVKNENSHQLPSPSKYKVYTSRWWMMFVLVVLNISNTWMMITFATAADTFIAFYEISTLQLNILSMTFMIVSIPVGFLASWVLDTRGLRAGLIIAAWCNGIGGFIRNISHFGTISQPYSYIAVLIGQIIAACAQPFIMFATTKLAALWFAEDRRATANMIGSMSKYFGLMTAFLVVPLIVKDKTDIPLVMYSISIPAWLVTFVATFGVKQSKPPSPPSPTAGQGTERFKSGLKQVSRLREQHLLVALSVSLFGGISISLYPVALELVVEVTYPVAVATSSGLCIIGGQLQSIVMMFAMQYLAQPLSFSEQQLGSACYTLDNATSAVIEPQDWTNANLYISNLISSVVVVTMVIFLKPKYKRLMMEKKILAHPVGQTVETECQIATVSVLYSTRL